MSECRKWIDSEKEELLWKRNKLRIIYAVIALIGVYVIILVLKSFLNIIMEKLKKRKEQLKIDKINEIVKEETIRTRVKKSIEEESSICKKRTKPATHIVFIRPPMSLDIRPAMTELIRPF
jgi:flagellar biosynthesis/type III secretory pathway M-ring protein FliF/YscJ